MSNPERHPIFRYCYQASIADGDYCGLPADSQTVYPGNDRMRNLSDRPWWVRKISLYAGDPATGRFELTLGRTRGGAQVKIFDKPLSRGGASAFRSYRLATVGGRNFHFKFLYPIIAENLAPILIQIGGTNNRAISTFGQATTGTYGHVWTARGLKTGKFYHLGETVTSTASYYTRDTPDFGEALELLDLEIRADATGTFPLFAGLGRDLENPAPFWMFAEPYAWNRLDLSFLHEGGLRLDPGDGLYVEGVNQTGGTVSLLALAMEAYQCPLR